MIPKYKQVKEYKLHCTICGECLQGDGSGYRPYYCKCGKWKWVFENPNDLRELIPLVTKDDLENQIAEDKRNGNPVAELKK